MVRLDLAPAADEDAALFDLPTTLDSAAAPVSSSESSSDDDEGPSALSTLAARQSELVREREQREADLKCVLRSQTTACCRRSCSCGSFVLPKTLLTQRRLARQRKDSRRERDARAKAAKAVVAVPSPSPSDDDEPDEPVASTSAAPRSIARLPSSVFAEASASIEAARLEAQRAEQLEREADAQSERHRRAKRRRLDEAPQPGSARDLGCVLRCSPVLCDSPRICGNRIAVLTDSCSRAQLGDRTAPRRPRNGAQRSHRDRAVVQDGILPAQQAHEAHASAAARTTARRASRAQEEALGARRALVAVPGRAGEEAEAEQGGREGAAAGASRRERVAGSVGAASAGVCGECAAMRIVEVRRRLDRRVVARCSQDRAAWIDPAAESLPLACLPYALGRWRLLSTLSTACPVAGSSSGWFDRSSASRVSPARVAR